MKAPHIYEVTRPSKIYDCIERHYEVIVYYWNGDYEEIHADTKSELLSRMKWFRSRNDFEDFGLAKLVTTKPLESGEVDAHYHYA